MPNYHYTKAVHLMNIMNDGKIRTTQIFRNDRPAVWLTTSDQWEPCCYSTRIDFSTGERIPMTLEEMRDTLGVCRIRISDRIVPTSWAKFKHVGGMSKADYHDFDAFSRKTTDFIDLWNCSLYPIGREHFESIEMLVGDQWFMWDGTISLQRFIDVCHSVNTDEDVPKMQNIPVNTFAKVMVLKKLEHQILLNWKQKVDEFGFLRLQLDYNLEQYHLSVVDGPFDGDSFQRISPEKPNEGIYLEVLWPSEMSGSDKLFISADGFETEILLDGLNAMAA